TSTTYTVTATNSTTSCTATASLLVSPNDYNFVTTNTVLVAGKTTVAALSGLSVWERSQQTTYFDGVGRPMQAVSTQGSPTQQDIIKPIIYDGYGREQYKYLPYTGGSDGRYKPNAILA